MKIIKKNFGISILETILVVGVVAIILVIIVPSLISFRRNQAIQNTTNSIVSLLEEARSRSIASYDNNFYSVFIDSDRATLFDGSVYSQSDSSNKVVFYESPVVLQSISLNGGGSSIIFNKLKGTTTKYGTINIQIPGFSTKTITVTSNGLISRD